MSVPWTMRLAIWWHRKRNKGHRSRLTIRGSQDLRWRVITIRCSGCERTWTA